MQRKWIILIVFMVLSLSGGVILVSTCTTQAHGASSKVVNSEALDYYSQGKYRHSMDILTKKKRLNDLEYYLMARDYQELQQPAKAVEIFRLIKNDKLAQLPQGQFYLENYQYYFSKAMIDSSRSYPFSLYLVSNFTVNMSQQSPYYKKLHSIYYYYQWKNTNNSFFFKDKKQNAEMKRYQRIIRFARGERDLISQLLLDYKKAGFKSPYKILFKVVKLSHLKNKTDLGRAIDIAVTFKKFDLARGIAKKHYKLVKDYDYYTRNMAIITYKSKSRKAAVTQLLELEKKGRASGKTVRLLLKYLKRRGMYTTGRQVAYRAVIKYGKRFYSDYIYFLDRTDYYTTLYNWYKSKSGEKGFLYKYGSEVIRIMLRNKPAYARELTTAYLNKRLSYSVLLISALQYYEAGATRSAYNQFLRIVMEYPYTYEWLVARHYESLLRNKYPETYKLKLSINLKKVKGYSIKNKAYYSMAYQEIDTGRFNKLIGQEKLKEYQSEYHKYVNRSFSVKEKIPGMDKYSQEPFRKWNQECLNYINQKINKKSNYKKYIRFRYTYKYKDLFKDINSRGEVVSRLHTLSMKIVLARRFHMILPVDMKKELYPLEVFDFINDKMKSTNNSLWVLSSFREESHFRKKARSWVGAQGYAQVMPSTARLLKKNMKRPELSNYDFEDNILMGITLFKHLFRRYKNNFAYALGAYNGGEGAVNRWRKKYKQYNTELWIECVEFDETRDYIKKIMLTRYFYEKLYGFPSLAMADFSRTFK